MEPTSNRPYHSVPGKDLILRDLLARDRTVLANERTLLAYIRTTLACLAAGAGLVHFVEGDWSRSAGWLLIVIAPLILVLGIRRFVQVQRDLAPLQQTGEPPSSPPSSRQTTEP